MTPQQRKRMYWRRNVTYVAVLLAIWFAVSYGCGIVFADELDRVRLGGFKLGFWFAQQGSIYVFVALIFVYVWLMNRLDRTVKDAELPTARVIETSARPDADGDEPAADAGGQRDDSGGAA